MQKILILLMSIVLVGCAGQRLPKEPPPKVTVSATLEFDPEKVWPLQVEGTYLQQVEVLVKGKKYSLSIHLTLENEKLGAIALSDTIGRLYNLVWTPDNLEWDKSWFLPDIITPKNIIADFLVVHLPVEQLQSALLDGQVSDYGDETGRTRIVSIGEVLRTVTYSKPMGDIWGHVVLSNPVQGYQLEIETVKQ